MCVCWCVRSPSTPPPLAVLCGVGVCVWAPVSATPRHSWHGCCGVRVCVRAPLVPRHSWLGRAALVCVFGFGFRLRPATPGWGDGVWVCWCGRSACTPPLLAGVCGVVVRVWARVWAAPRHSWLGWWGVCVLVRVLPLYPATPGWGVRCGCVGLGWGFGCAPPLLAGVLGCVCMCACSPCTPPLLAAWCGVGVCAWVRVSATPRHSWPGCWGVCVLVCVLPLYPATPGWGVRCGCVGLGSGFCCAPPLLVGVLWCACMCACSPCTPPLLARPCVLGLGFWLRPATPGWGGGLCVCWYACSPCASPLLARVCGVGVCVWAGVSAAPRQSWLGCWAVCVCVRAPLVPRHSWLGCAAWVCVLWFGFRLAPPLLAGVLGCVCARSHAPLVPRHSWLECAVWVCVFGLRFWLRPATPGRGVGVCVFVCGLPLFPATTGWGVRRGCVCWGSVFGCAPPPRAGVLGCVCAAVRAPLVPRHSWLSCAVWVCGFGLGSRLRPATPGWGVVVCEFVCVITLYPATPGWGVQCGCVCLGSGFGCAPPPLAGVLGCVCPGLGAPLVPRLSWLGSAVWVWVFGLGFGLRPATSGWGVGVCVSVCVLPLYPATPGWAARRACVCLGSGCGCAPPLLAWVSGVPALLVPRHSWLGCAAWVCVFGFGFRLRSSIPGWAVGVCVFVCKLPLYPATPAWAARRACVCLGSGCGCAPPLLAWVSGVRAPLVPRHSWLGCAAWVCVFGFGFRLRSATPGWGVGVCVCWCGHSPCTPPLLAGVCGVGVCVWAGVWAVPRHCWRGCWGVCLLVCALRLYPATTGCGVRCGCVCLDSGFGCAPPLLAGVGGVCAPLVRRHS